MKLKVSEIVINSNEHKCKSYDIVSKEYCCDDMWLAVRQHRIRLHTEDNEEINPKIDDLHPNVVLSYIDSYLIEDFLTNDEWNYAIKYCPFCGKPIEIEVVESKDLTDKFDRLKKLSKELRHKANITDSKKEEQKLLEQYREVESKLHQYYKLGETIDIE